MAAADDTRVRFTISEGDCSESDTDSVTGRTRLGSVDSLSSTTVFPGDELNVSRRTDSDSGLETSFTHTRTGSFTATNGHRRGSTSSLSSDQGTQTVETPARTSNGKAMLKTRTWTKQSGCVTRWDS